jgi:phage terminase small subunit
VSKKPPKDKDKRLSFPGAGKPKDARTGRAAPKGRKGKMEGKPSPDEDLFAGRDAVVDEITAEHQERVEREDAIADPDELASRALNPRQRAFAEHYAKTGNATQSYKAAGYSETSKRSVENCASRLLGHAGVRAYIGELLDELASPRIADAQERQEFLTAVMRGKVKRKSVFYGEAVTTYTAVAESIKAAELLAKINGELTEKREVKGDVAIRIVRGNSAPSAIGEKVGEDD